MLDGSANHRILWDDGLADDVEGLPWGSIESAEGLELLLEIAGHALD